MIYFLQDLINKSIDSHLNAIVIPNLDMDIHLSYKELQQIILRAEETIFNQLHQDSHKSLFNHHEIISIVASNSIHFVVLFLSLISLGFAVAPLNPAFKKKDFEFYLKDTQSKLILVSDDEILKKNESYTILKDVTKQLNMSMYKVSVNIETLNIECNLFGKANDDSTSEISKDHVYSRYKSMLKLDGKDAALILHTSGTTGKPKCKI